MAGGYMTRKIKIASAAVIVVAAGVLYYLVNPADSVWAPKCVFRAVTGFECPGCGSQRLLHALLHGDIAAAWHANAYLLCMTPVLLLMVYAAVRRQRFPRLYASVNSIPVIIIVSISLIAWTILRNL